MHFVSWVNVPSMEKLCGSQLSQNECTVKMIKGLSYSLWVLLRPLVFWTAMGKKNLSSYPLSYKDESLKALACYMWLANGLICCLPLIVFQEKTNASGCGWHTHKSLRRHILAGLARCPLFFFSSPAYDSIWVHQLLWVNQLFKENMSETSTFIKAWWRDGCASFTRCTHFVEFIINI